MRSILRSLLPLALLLAAASCNGEKDANERRVVIFFTTDEHSQLFASSPELDDFLEMQALQAGTPLPTTGKLKGGVARRMTILKAQRAAVVERGDKVASLTLSSGDFSQGSLASAAWLTTSPELVMMKRMGYDAVALGNHEFDLGPKALATSIAAAAANKPPLVLTNVNFSAASPADDDLAAIYGEDKAVAPFRILTTSNGLRIGVVASMGVGAGTVSNPAPVTFWTGADNTARFTSVVAALQATITHLREHVGVDAVILLGHGGIGAVPADPTKAIQPGEDELLAQALKGVDLVLSGHSHDFTPQPRIFYGSGTAVPVVQPHPYGRDVGKLELVFRDDGVQGNPPRPYLDPNATQFIPVDDTTPPDATILPELQQLTVGALAIGARALDPTVTAPSFLERTIGHVTGTTPPPTTTAAAAAQLWNTPLGKLDFAVVGISPGETAAMNLDADAILAGVREIVPATEIAVQASGPIRGDLEPSSYASAKPLTFADLYHLVPLGGDPVAAAAPLPANPTLSDLQNFANAIPGYPLVRFSLPTAALRIVYEATLQTALGVNGDFFVGASGLEVRYDVTRTRFDITKPNPVAPGWVTYMALKNGSTTTVLYDVSNSNLTPFGFFAVNPAELRTVATTLYVASFASAFGVTLYNDANGNGLGDPGEELASPALAIVRRADTSAVKDFEALGRYVAAACAGNTGNPGFLPSVYDASKPEGKLPNRVRNCTGGCN